MSIFTDKSRWSACVVIRFPFAYIEDWKAGKKYLGSSAWIKDVGGDHQVANWDEYEKRGWVKRNLIKANSHE